MLTGALFLPVGMLVRALHRDAGINPRPSNGAIPLWRGGLSDAALRRAGRLGYGWLAGGPPDDNASVIVEQVRRYAAAPGHRPDALGIDPQISLVMASPEDLVSFVEGWQRLGATHVSLAAAGQGLTQLEHLSALEVARDRVRAITS